MVNAQQTQDTTSNQYRTESQMPQDAAQQGRERIQATDLPEDVKKSLEGEDYRGWLISGAFKAQGSASAQPGDANATGAQGEEVYLVEMKNGAETKTVAFNNSGEIIEGYEEMDNSQNNQFEQTDPMDRTNPSDQSLPTDPTQDPASPQDIPATPPDPNTTPNTNDQWQTNPTPGQTPPPGTPEPGTPAPGTPAPGTPAPGTPDQSGQ